MFLLSGFGLGGCTVDGVAIMSTLSSGGVPFRPFME
jgi:hypothetical protein